MDLGPVAPGGDGLLHKCSAITPRPAPACSAGCAATSPASPGTQPAGRSRASDDPVPQPAARAGSRCPGPNDQYSCSSSLFTARAARTRCQTHARIDEPCAATRVEPLAGVETVAHYRRPITERLRSPAGAATPPVMASTAGRTRGVSAYRSPRRVVAGEDVTARGDTDVEAQRRVSDP